MIKVKWFQSIENIIITQQQSIINERDMIFLIIV